MPYPLAALLRRGGRHALLVLEFSLLGALVLLTRCANYADVFVDGKIYFVDADCYARMTRVRLVSEHPGLIVRQHDFENYPAGTRPHTTAPLDYFIAALSALLAPLTAQPLDLAGALVSPLLALGAGWFLCWWTRRMGWRYRWAGLLFFALNPILAHGTALGRPDHQALLILLLLVALAAEWSWEREPARAWGVLSGLSWGLACWVSLYEPLILGAFLALQPARLWARSRRLGWACAGGVLLFAALLERRLPALPDPALRLFYHHWAATIGELRPLGLTSGLWWQWCGGFLLLAPILLWKGRRAQVPRVFWALLGGTFLLCAGQARWGYFLALLLALTIAALLEVVRQGWLGWTLALAALLPCLAFWDGAFWPNDEVWARRVAARREAVEWRAVAESLPHDRVAPLLAPWWLSPSAAYWSGQPAVAGSSHESLPGIEASARFFLATEPAAARQILREHRVTWVLAYDADRVAENSAALLAVPIPSRALCFTLDRAPRSVPNFLALAGQNNAAKLYQVRQ